MGKNDIYRKYQTDVRTTPYFVLVFEGIHDGVWPWMMSAMPWESGPGQNVDGPGGSDDYALIPGTEQTDGTERPTGTEAVTGTESVPEQTGTEAHAGTESAGTEAGTESIGEPATELAPQPKEFIQVDQSYFDDAVFIGDSRTVGLRDYGGTQWT